MRILHCCLACFYIDNYSYQENILPRYHKKLGHEVRIVASTETFDSNGNFTYTEPSEYYNEDDILITRLPYVERIPSKIIHKIRKYVGLKEYLDSFKPELIFLHDIQFLDICYIKEYAKNNRVRIVADCHADFSNSARNFISKKILHGVIYKYCAKQIEPYTEKFYGVLPARVDFLVDVYGIPKDKVELLVMGSEDEKAIEAISEESKSSMRKKHGIKEDDFLIVTGGKIDYAKKQTLLLMDAVNGCDNENIKLIVFGSVVPELDEEIKNRLSTKVLYIGWLTSDEAYKYFGAADLVCFPGRHSVFWEQVVGIGVPMIVKYWNGTTHIDCGGNVKFLYSDSVSEITRLIKEVTEETIYKKMLEVAKRCRYQFMYSEIAKRCIEDR